MNRLSFLKTMGVGIAAAVITPKILVDALPKEAMPIASKEKQEYAYYEEDHTHSTDGKSARVFDMCMNKEEQLYIVTAIGFGTIELRSADIDTIPNLLDVKTENFGEYFIIMNNAFGEGTGSPR